MKDIVVVGPVLLAGGVALEGLTHVGFNRGTPTNEYIALVAFLVVVLLVWYRTKLGSAERLKAMELGLGRPEPPRQVVSKEACSIAASALVGTPVGVAGIAWMTCLTTRCDPNLVWPMAGLLGMTAMVCGTVLLARKASPDPARAPVEGLKPSPVDADAYDVVARRG